MTMKQRRAVDTERFRGPWVRAKHKKTAWHWNLALCSESEVARNERLSTSPKMHHRQDAIPGKPWQHPHPLRVIDKTPCYHRICIALTF